MDETDEVRVMRLRVPGDLYRRITEKAESERRSIHAQVLHLIETAIGQPSPAMRTRKPRGIRPQRKG